jgi:alanyl aminopeptidase
MAPVQRRVTRGGDALPVNRLSMPRSQLHRGLGALLLFVAGTLGAASPPAPPGMRLTDTVVPVHYDLALTLDPDADAYTGSIDIRIRVAQATDLVWLNATGLTVDEARVLIEKPMVESLAAEIVPGDDDVIGVRLSAPLPVGQASLSLRFKGTLNNSEVAGLFKQRDGDDWYVLTQLEAIYARRAFPCFDEPRFRAPWRITLTVPEGQRAISNMPIESERTLLPGWREVSFRPTPPIASYLIAIAVGPWDVLDGGTAGRDAIPLRYIAPKGRASEAAYAASITPKIVERLEAYFGQPFPFPKQDSITIPNSGYFFGAMENVGLITYDQRLLLAKPDATTTRFKQSYVATAAHEIAHQWFGNLVTPAWWDDIWLNESFATWLGNKITMELMPEWRWEFTRVDTRQWAIGNDRLASARRIRQPIVVRSDIRSAFDGISYGKGSAVLSMFEDWLGPQKFRAGVRRYMAAHAWGVATADDFFAALAAEDDAVLPAFRGFVDRPGVPKLAIALDCSNMPRLTLRQSRFVPYGSTAEAQQRWVFPACFQYGDAKQGKTQCTLVRDEASELRLDTAACPEWVIGNRAGIGYFLPALDAALYAAVPKAARVLGPMDWVPLLADTNTLARGAAVPLPDALALAALAARQRDPRVYEEALAIAMDVPRAAARGADGVRYAAWVRTQFGPRARALGWRPKAREDSDTQRLRRSLVPFVADRGADAALAREARTLAARWPEDPRAVPPDVRAELLEVAARTAGSDAAALYAHMVAAATATRDSGERRDLLAALGAFRDPALAAQAAQLMLTGPFEPRAALLILRGQLEGETTRAGTLAWLDRNYDALMSRGAHDDFDGLPGWADGACSDEERNLFVAAFATRAPKVDGGARAYAKALERIDLCLAYRRAQEPALAAWLAVGTARR